jgi:hypothetical protein
MWAALSQDYKSNREQPPQERRAARLLALYHSKTGKVNKKIKNKSPGGLSSGDFLVCYVFFVAMGGGVSNDNPARGTPRLT